METLDEASKFRALAQQTRIDAMRLLSGMGAAGIAAGDLATALGQAPSTLSFHLAALEQAGLVRSERQGRHVIYSVRLDGLRGLFRFLGEICSPNTPKLYSELARLLPDEAIEHRGIWPCYNVLFLCTHNSARSIMAQAILESLGKDSFRAYSAGSEPAKRPMPEVVERLQTLGHDIEKLRSKSWDEFCSPDAPRMDFVLILCDMPEGQFCPELGRGVTAAWPFPDPKKFKGSKIERATNLSALYGMIRTRLEIFINLPIRKLDREALKIRLDELGDITRFA